MIIATEGWELAFTPVPLRILQSARKHNRFAPREVLHTSAEKQFATPILPRPGNRPFSNRDRHKPAANEPGWDSEFHSARHDPARTRAEHLAGTSES